MVDRPQFRKALQFYVDLVRDAGESRAPGASYNQCLAQYLDGKVAMWYDATVAAGLLEADDSDVKGKNGYAPAPVERTRASGWLWSWALATLSSSSKADLAWRYISWATGPQYIKEAGTRIAGGWAAIPAGTRRSTYAIPEYKKAARAFVGPELHAIESAPVENPGTSKRPGNPGVQYVGIPEFQDVGDQCTELFSAVIAGKASYRFGAHGTARTSRPASGTDRPEAGDDSQRLSLALTSRGQSFGSSTLAVRPRHIAPVALVLVLTVAGFIVARGSTERGERRDSENAPRSRRRRSVAASRRQRRSPRASAGSCWTPAVPASRATSSRGTHCGGSAQRASRPPHGSSGFPIHGVRRTSGVSGSPS